MSLQNGSRTRETLVGLAVVVSLMAFIYLLILAGKGPGYLTNRTEIQVVFSDGQGIRVGSPVRISGLDVGQVAKVDLAEYNGRLLARLALRVPSDLAAKFREDVKITIQASLTGQNCVNVISTGYSNQPFKPGLTIRGVETSLFDPILKDVGLGPEERADLGNSIRKVRQMLDQAAPQIASTIDDAKQMVASVKSTINDARPAALQTLVHVESLTRQLEEQGPKISQVLTKVEALASEVGTLVVDNKPKLAATLENVEGLTKSARQTLDTERPKISRLIDGLEPVRQRSERVLYNLENTTEQTNEMLARNRANIDRSVQNVRDTTEWASQLVQKLFTNPFVLSPFYRPKAEDIRVQSVMDTSRYFLKGASELNDQMKRIESLQKLPQTPQRKQELDQLYRQAFELMQQIRSTEQKLADGVRQQGNLRLQSR